MKSLKLVGFALMAPMRFMKSASLSVPSGTSVLQENAVRAQLGGMAAHHHVQQQPPVAEPVEHRRLPRREGWEVTPGRSATRNFRRSVAVARPAAVIQLSSQLWPVGSRTPLKPSRSTACATSRK